MEYNISNDKLSVVLSSKGAELRSIISNETEYLWNGNEKYWSGRSPLLFPFVGRFTEGQYRFQGKNYPMNIHGFARKMEFKVEKTEQNSIEFILEDTPETYEIYPFHFLLKVSYTLENEKIRIRYEVKNISHETMYFGIGGHPGFMVPLEEGLDFSDYYLEFSAQHTPTKVGLSDTCYINGQDEEYLLKEGKKIPLEHPMFDQDAIVLKNVGDQVTLKSDKGNREVTVIYPSLPYLGLWHAPRTEAPYVCIEPWTSLPSREGIIEDFQFKSDLIRLGANNEYINEWSIIVK